MSFKTRYIEENFLKNIDRAFHANEYKQLKDELYSHRANARMISEKIAELEREYPKYKNSPQGNDIQRQIENLKAEYQKSKDQLEVYSDLGRKGLGVDPLAHKLDKAESEGLKTGLGVGAVTGGLGGLALGHSLFHENNTFSFKNRHLLEEGRS